MRSHAKDLPGCFSFLPRELFSIMPYLACLGGYAAA